MICLNRLHDVNMHGGSRKERIALLRAGRSCTQSNDIDHVLLKLSLLRLLSSSAFSKICSSGAHGLSSASRAYRNTTAIGKP